MLQASTGKLFTYPAGRKNLLRGVLYTNLTICSENAIETAFGRIIPFSMQRQPNVISCEIIEHIELAGTEPGIIFSNGIDIYLTDFADIISFFLGVICTPDSELAKRLICETPRSGTTAPQKLLSKTFDTSAPKNLAELEKLNRFTQDLLGLKRKDYLLAIKAIRTYVTALHRLAENIDLAYTLLVMSIEALVQDVGDYESQWSDVDSEKRIKLEDIFKDLDEETSLRIKNAIIESEHLSLTKKFKHFILKNIPSDYFNEDAALQEKPVGRMDLESALQNLYKTRSKYVHELKALPKEFCHYSGTAETNLIDDEILLSMQGLTRLARSIILEFINKQVKTESEPCDYNIENPNIARMKLCPSTWIGSPEGLTNKNCNLYFSGFISLLDNYFNQFPNGTIYDIRKVIEKGFSVKGKLANDQRTSLIAVTALFMGFTGHRYPLDIKITRADRNLLDTPSIQTMLTFLVLGKDTMWKLSDHERELNSYYKTRLKSTGFRLPHKLEACLGIAFAERLRALGEHERAKEQLLSTADNFPVFKRIRELTINYNENSHIDWLKIIYPNIDTALPQSTLECIGL